MDSEGQADDQAAKWAVGGFSEVLAKEAAAFGVKVISVEPGGIRTDWGVSAGSNTPPLLPDYEPSVGATLGYLKGYAGNEYGDPAKMAAVIVDLASRDTVRAHLLLGSDDKHVFGLAETTRLQ